MLKKMAKNKRTAPSLRPALKNGAWGYWHAAMASFDCARMELYQDMTKANYDAKAASDGAVFCETWLNITKWNIPSIRLRNYYISLFSDIGYSITDMLDG
ncbi:hypothetical protein CUMW_046840 [Citrus unshiu]|nr:hypothetical protein CUMW_046840 [Citrus unshiu]